jgi:hypothetical protein
LRNEAERPLGRPLDNLNTRLLLGQEVDLSDHAAAVSDMVRVASRLDLRRRAKDIGPTLADYQEAQRAEQREQHEVQQHE